MKRPNVLFVFADQWRAQATGYSGNAQVKTPNLDALASRSINLTNAVSGVPVCTPYRACFLTGQYPHIHGLFLNDAHLRPNGNSIAQAFAAVGYDTAYIGKWHVNGQGRSKPIDKESRLGFDYWKVLECTHDYHNSRYYEGDSTEPQTWDGYDAEAQTRDAIEYIRDRDGERPFFLALSWGPPHDPYQTAPERFRRMYDSDEIRLRPNVPPESAAAARVDLAGYYAHCTALDEYVGWLVEALEEQGISDDTLLVVTSDHGDMLGSHGVNRKQKPWDESIRVPFLVRCPSLLGQEGRARDDLFVDSPDIMPTLLGLCGIDIPVTVEGTDFSAALRHGTSSADPCAVLASYHPFGEWARNKPGGVYGYTGREYRGVRTPRYTYVETLDGAWLLYDNEVDPYQLTNLIEHPSYRDARIGLQRHLHQRLTERGDSFETGEHYLREFGHSVDETGTIPYET